MIFDLVSFILFVMGTGMLFETSLFSLWHRSLFSSPVFVYDGLKFSNEEGRVFIGRGISLFNFQVSWNKIHFSSCFRGHDEVFLYRIPFYFL